MRIGTAICAALLALSNAAPGTAAAAVFNQNLHGFSVFTEEGDSIHLRGGYRDLPKVQTIFSVVYGNNNCDPAQAFPVGPVTVKGRKAVADVVAPNPTGVDLAKTGSISVRRGDDQTDIDKDGIKGSSDVVAVAGQPGIGLIECKSNPLTN